MAKWTDGPWKVAFDAPTAIVPGHLIKTANEVETPIALLWQGGGTKGKPTQIANAKLIAKSPELAELLRRCYTELQCEHSGNLSQTGCSCSLCTKIEKLLSEIGAGD